jgi:CheY-like chemotaxis protein
MTILLVEDHANTRRAMRMWLEMTGHSVIEAGDMKAGLAAGRKPFDLLVCDLGLPDGDGWTLLEKLNKRRPTTAIAISGYCSAADIARSEAAGFVVHMPKPFTPEEFDAALAKVALRHNGQKPRRTKET